MLRQVALVLTAIAATAAPASAQFFAERNYRLQWSGSTQGGLFCLDTFSGLPFRSNPYILRLQPNSTGFGDVVTGRFAIGAQGERNDRVRVFVVPTGSGVNNNFAVADSQGALSANNPPYVYSNVVSANTDRSFACGFFPGIIGGGGGNGGAGGGIGGGGGSAGGGGVGGGVGGGGGTGGGTGTGGGEVIVVTIPSEIRGLQRNVARFTGDTVFAGGYQITEQIAFGFTRGTGLDESARWNVWASPRFIGSRDRTAGASVTGDYYEMAAGLDYRLSPNLILGLGVGGDRTENRAGSLGLRMDRDGWMIGPYLGWRIRPTTVFDIWTGYAGYEQRLSVPGESGKYTTNRWFLTANLTEIIQTPYVELRPRLTFQRSFDWANAFTSSAGTRFLSDAYGQASLQASLGASRAFPLANGTTLRPFLRLGVTYALDQAVNDAPRADGTQRSLPRWSGQVRGGVGWQVARGVEISAQAGYLSGFVGGLQAWEGRALVSFAF